jgi:hypothetical protein
VADVLSGPVGSSEILLESYRVCAESNVNTEGAGCCRIAVPLKQATMAVRPAVDRVAAARFFAYLNRYPLLLVWV